MTLAETLFYFLKNNNSYTVSLFLLVIMCIFAKFLRKDARLFIF